MRLIIFPRFAFRIKKSNNNWKKKILWEIAFKKKQTQTPCKPPNLEEIAVRALLNSRCAAGGKKVICWIVWGFLRQFAQSYLQSRSLPVLQPGAGSLYMPGSSSELLCALEQRHSQMSVFPLPEKGGHGNLGSERLFPASSHELINNCWCDGRITNRGRQPPQLMCPEISDFLKG